MTRVHCATVSQECIARSRDVGGGHRRRVCTLNDARIISQQRPQTRRSSFIQVFIVASPIRAGERHVGDEDRFTAAVGGRLMIEERECERKREREGERERVPVSREINFTR